jgi:Family of unknown function (DUF6252)
VLLLVSVASCGSNGPAGPSGTGSSSGSSSGGNSTSALKGSITMLVDGIPWAATSGVSATRSAGILTIGGTDPTWTLGLAVTASAPGTFVIPGAGPQAGNNALLLFTQNNTTAGSWAANAVQGSGTVTITSLTLTAVSGAFTFLAFPTSGIATGGRNVTNGTFTIDF